MIRHTSILAPLVGMVVWAAAPEVRAQGYAQVPPCTCGGQGPHYHMGPGGMHSHSGAGDARAGAGGLNALRGYGGGGMDAGSDGPITGLPRGRRYYGGRFFGSFNNRYYGPQYGNF
jgi:hypothetical protein